MVGVAQLVEPGIVIPVVVGSSPIVHPIPATGRLAKAESTLMMASGDRPIAKSSGSAGSRMGR